MSGNGEGTICSETTGLLQIFPFALETTTNSGYVAEANFWEDTYKI